MNEFKKWFEQQLSSIGLTPLELVKQMGYINTDKGLRRYNEFLEYPNKSHNKFIQLLCSALNLNMTELHQKITERKKQIASQRKPFIQLVYPYLGNISPLSHRGWLRELLRLDVPMIVQLLPVDEQELQLKRLAKQKLKALDIKLASKITSFEYYTLNGEVYNYKLTA